jgi:hypothetical protein
MAWSPDVLALLELPRSFAHSTLHNLIVLGHEFAHIEERRRFFKREQFVKLLLDDLKVEGASASVAEKWLTEVLLDAVFARRYGPAASLVFSDYAQIVGAIRPYTATHPPASFRLRVMWNVLSSAGFFKNSRPTGSATRELIAELSKHETMGRRFKEDAPSSVREVAEKIEDGIPAILRRAEQFAPSAEAYLPDRLDVVDRLAEEFQRGVARSDRLSADLRSTTETVADLYNAAAGIRCTERLVDFARSIHHGVQTIGHSETTTAAIRLDELLARALEGVHLAQRWPT